MGGNRGFLEPATLSFVPMESNPVADLEQSFILLMKKKETGAVVRFRNFRFGAARKDLPKKLQAAPAIESIIG